MAARQLQLVSVALSIALTLGACGGSVKQAMIERGFSEAYAEGYDHGCSSGKADGGSLFDQPAKDQSRYGADADYTKGWDEGYAKCKAEQTELAREARRRNPSRDK